MTNTNDPDNKILNRVRALLAKAESTTSPEEAEAFLNGAINLMAKYELDEATVHAKGDRRDDRKVIAKRFDLKGSYKNEQKDLWCRVARALSARAIGHRHGGKVDVQEISIFGTEQAIEMTTMLVSSIMVQAAKGVRNVEVRATARRRWEPMLREYVWDRSVSRADVILAKKSYLAAFYERAAEMVAEVHAQPVAAENEGAALVLLSDAKRAEDLRKEMYPRLKMPAQRSYAGYAAEQGMRDGSRANVGRTSFSGGSRLSIGAGS